MAHHKRKRPKHQRAGCLMCKPWKDERYAKHPKNPKADRRAPRWRAGPVREEIAERLANDG